LQALLDDERESGVQQGNALSALAEAMVLGDSAALAAARATLGRALGSDAVVDALGVASNFERMVRIADASGVELGESLTEFSADIREDLKVERPAGWAG